MRSRLLGILVNLVLSAAKISAGFVGRSFAPVADGLESGADVLSGLVVYFGLKIAVKPPDKDRHFSRVMNSTPHLTSEFVFRSGSWNLQDLSGKVARRLTFHVGQLVSTTMPTRRSGTIAKASFLSLALFSMTIPRWRKLLGIA